MAWQPIIRHSGEGEKILFKIGLMTFKASSAETDGQFALLETILPPGARVEAHSHPEAEWFYVLESKFRFRIGDPAQEAVVGPGAFLSVPPHVRHEYEHLGTQAGRLLGMMLPGGSGGLESFFRQVGVPVTRAQDVPDLDQPVEHLQAAIAAQRARNSS